MIRLARKPSRWTNFFGRLIFTIVWTSACAAASTWAWPHRFGTPLLALIILAIFDLIAIGLVTDVGIRFRRMLRDREPVVEVDRDAPAYGESVQVRIVEEHPESIAEIGVKLVGECDSRAVREFTEHRETVVTHIRCYEEELLRLRPASGEPISRIVQMHLPKSPPADNVAWKIVVDSHLKRGGTVEHVFPLRVHDLA